MGSKKPPKVKASKATSAFSGIKEYNVNMDGFGSATSAKKDGKLTSTSSLAPQLQPSYDSAAYGMANNLGVLEQTPTQQLQDLMAGNNSYYNLQSEMNNRMLDSQIGKAQSRFSANGLENSTVRGGMEGALINDATLRDLSTRQSSLDYLNTRATSGIATQNAVLQGLANLQQIPLTMSNQNIIHGFDNTDQTAMFNAQQQQQANMLNAQMQAQAAAQQQAMWGNILGSVAGVGMQAAMMGMGVPAGAGGAMAGMSGGGGGQMAGGLQSWGNNFSQSLGQAPNFLGATYGM